MMSFSVAFADVVATAIIAAASHVPTTREVAIKTFIAKLLQRMATDVVCVFVT
jgi:hypothetical protein